MPRNIFVWGEKNERHTLMTFPAGSGVPGPTPTGVLMPSYLGSDVGTSVGWGASGYHGQFSVIPPLMYELSATHKLLPQYDGWHIIDCSNPSSPATGPAFNPAPTPDFLAFLPVEEPEDIQYNTSPGDWGLVISPWVAFWGTTIIFLAQVHGAASPGVGGSDFYLWEVIQCGYDPGSLVISQTTDYQMAQGEEQPFWMEMVSPSLLLLGVGIFGSGAGYLRYPISAGVLQPSPDVDTTFHPPYARGYGPTMFATEPPWTRAGTAGAWVLWAPNLIAARSTPSAR